MSDINGIPGLVGSQAALTLWDDAIKSNQDPERLLTELADEIGIPWIDLHSSLIVDPELLEKVPEYFSKAHTILPISKTDDQIKIAVATPLLGTLPLELSRVLGSKIQFVLARGDLLRHLIDKAYSEQGAQGVLSELDDEGFEELENIEDLKDMAQAAPVVKLVNKIFMDAIAAKASDIHISPYENGLDIRYRIDGILHKTSTIQRKFQAAIISRIKIMSNLDIAERRIPQDGRIKLKIERRDFDIRVATTPTVFGEGAVMRILDKTSIQVAIDKVGFHPSMLSQWLEILGRSNQVVLVTGPTGSGKTTTLYASLNHVKSAELKLISVEDPVEYQLSGIDQIQVNTKTGMSFAAALRSILRQDPDIIMIGEIRDEETAEIAVQSALTGHLVLSTLHTNDAPSAVTRLIEMGVEHYLISSSVAGVLAQRLVRRLCVCKTRDENGTWVPTGCEQCGNTGFKGRLGIFELLIMTDEIRQLISEHADTSRIKSEAVKNGMITILQDGFEKVKQGLTTESEIRRVASE
ncbi:MAG: GspE/PulE family protein [Desulfobacterales bacterium]|nr:GspE/PulE family protein [Desulfobacterales bacterium]